MIMNNNNCSIMGGSKKKVKKTRNRKPVAPKFALPQRGYRCINWLPIGKREIKVRVEELGRHRLQVVELAINNAIKHLFEYFNLNNSIDNTSSPSFKLEYDPILKKLTSEWDDKLLNDWNGPKLKSTTWEKKLWEGKNGYWKLCKNWADQNKYQVSHIFWCNVYTKIMIFIKSIANKQFPDNQSLQTAFLNCLKYACLYSIFAAKIGFPKTRLLPLLVNTVIAKNKELKRYLQKEYDPELDIYKWKEQESMKYDEINNAATKDNKVCAAVKERCIEYSAQKMQSVFNQFYQSKNSMIPSTILDVNKYNVSIQFDASGNITNKRTQTTKPKPKKTKTTRKTSTSSSSRSSSLMEEDASNYNHSTDDIKYNESPSTSNGNARSSYRGYDPYAYDDEIDDQPSLPTVPPPSLPVPVPAQVPINNNNHPHNRLVNPLYGATHSQSTRVMDIRADPTMSLHRRQSFPNIPPSLPSLPSTNMYRSGIPSNLRRDRSDISNLSVDHALNGHNPGNYNRLNDINRNQFDQRMSSNRNHGMNTATSGPQSMHDLQRENRRLQRQIAQCQAMLQAQMDQMRNPGTMGINNVNINDNMDYQMRNMGNSISINNTNDNNNMMSRDVQRPLHNFGNHPMNNNPPFTRLQIPPQPRLPQQSPPSQSQYMPPTQSLQSLQSSQSIQSISSIPSSESSSTISHGTSIGFLGDMSNMNRNSYNYNNNNGSNIMSPSSTIPNHLNYTDQTQNNGHTNNNNNIDSGQGQQRANMMFTISDADSATVCFPPATSIPPNIYSDNTSILGFDMNQGTMNNTNSYYDR